MACSIIINISLKHTIDKALSDGIHVSVLLVTYGVLRNAKNRWTYNSAKSGRIKNRREKLNEELHTITVMHQAYA